MLLTKASSGLQAALNLAFVGSETLDQRITFTRADPAPAATRFNSSGLMEIMGVNQLLYSTWAGSSGLGVYPTNWGVSGSDTNAVTSNGDGSVSVRRINPSGFNGLSRTAAAIDGVTTGVQYSVSVYIKVPTGVTASDALFYAGTGVPSFTTIATAATLNAAPKDTWVRYSFAVTFTTIPNALAFGANAAAVGTGFDLKWPQIEVGATATTYAATTTAATSGPRFMYDPNQPADSGNRGPELVTNGDFAYGGNAAQNSDGPTAAVWTKGNTTVADAGVISPYSGVSYKTVYDNSTSGNHEVATPIVGGVTGGLAYVATFVIKAAGVTQVSVACAGTSTVFGDTYIDLVNYVKTSGAATTTVTRLADGAAKIVVTGTASITGTAIFYISAVKGGTKNYIGDGSAAFLVGGVQLELGSTASNYTPTTTAAVAAPGWTQGANWTIQDGAAVHTLGASGSLLSNLTLTVGKWYAMSYTLTGAYMNLENGSSYTSLLVGSYTIQFQAKATTFAIQGGSTCTIDNISVKEVIPATTGVELLTPPFGVPVSFDNTITAQTATGFSTVGATTACRVYANTAPGITVGKRYRATGRLVNISTSNVVVFARASTGGTGSTLAQSAGLVSGNTFSVEWTAATTQDSILFVSSATGAGVSMTFDSLSISELVFTPQGLWIEEARTNLLLHSRDMTQAAWTKGDTTAARTQVGIDGAANTATLLTEGSAGTAQTIGSGTISAGATLTYTRVLKRGNTDWIRMRVDDGAIGADGWFNLNTGATGATAALSTATGISNAITNLGGGWYRCSLTVTLTGSVAVTAFAALASASANSSVTRVAASNYIADNAQLEAASTASTIIVTGAASATRAADRASMTGTNYSSWMNAAAGTFVGEAVYASQTPNALLFEGANAGSAAGGSIGLSGGAVGDRIRPFIRQGAFRQEPASTGATFAASAIVKAAISWGATDSAIYDRGTKMTSAATPAQLDWANELWIGSRTGTTLFLNGAVRRITFYASRLPDATLAALTT
jgi:hypothetical protein